MCILKFLAGFGKKLRGVQNCKRGGAIRKEDVISAEKEDEIL